MAYKHIGLDLYLLMHLRVYVHTQTNISTGWILVRPKYTGALSHLQTRANIAQ